MNIGIIGAGRVATSLARIWKSRGHELRFGVRPGKEDATQGKVSVEEAAAFGDVVVLAVPYSSVGESLAAAGPLRGKILLSCVNALKQDYSGLAVGTTTSGAEEVSRLAPGARVVSAIPAFVDVLDAASPLIGGQSPSLFVAGDDREANEVARSLMAETGAEIIDAGPLVAARYIEPALMLLVHLAYTQQMGGLIGLRLLLPRLQRM